MVQYIMFYYAFGHLAYKCKHSKHPGLPGNVPVWPLLSRFSSYCPGFCSILIVVFFK